MRFPLQRRMLSGLTLVGSLWLSTACNPTLGPLHAPQSSAGVDSAGTPYTADQVRAAVLAGLAAKRWTTLAVSPGEIEAEVSAGGHTARISIKYDAQGWEISHESSSAGLKYNPNHSKGEVIHRRYNNWINLLDKAIRKNLSVPGQAVPTPPQPPEERPLEPKSNPKPTTDEPEPEPNSDDYM